MKNFRFFLILLSCVLISNSAFTENQSFSSPEEEKLYNLGFKAYRDRLYPTAQKQIEDFIKKYPDSAMKNKSYSILGEIYYQQSNLPDAERIFDKLAKTSGYEDIAFFWSGKILAKKNDIQNAKKTFEEFQNKFPKSDYLPYVEFSLAQIYFNENSFGEASILFEKLYAKYPNDPIGQRSILELARCFYRAKRYDKSEAILRNYIREPRTQLRKAFLGEVYFLLAQANEKQGLYTRSIKYFRRSIKDLKNQQLLPQAYYGLGWGYWQIKDFKDSSIWFKKFLKKFPNTELTPPAKLRLAECYISLGKYALAIGQLNEFIETYPENQGISGIRFWLAEAYSHQDMLTEAETEYKTVIQKYPDSQYTYRAYYGLGWIYYKKKDYDQSRTMFYKVINQGTEDSLRAEAMLKIGDSYFLSQKFEQAIQIYMDVLEKHPGKSADRVLFQIGNTYLKMDEFDKAIASFDTLISGYPKSNFIMVAVYKKGNVFFTKGMYKEAMECYIDVFDKTTSAILKERAGFKIGKTYIDMGEYAKAEEHFIKLLELFPQGRYKTESLYELGLCAYTAGDMDKAFKYFQQCLQKEGSNKLQPEIRFWIGENFFNKGQFNIAKIAFLGSANEFPNHELSDDSLFLSARCSFKMGDYKDAKILFDQLVEKYPKSSLVPDALFGCAESLIFLKEYASALETYKKILKENPNTYLLHEIYLRQGDVFFGLNEFENAIESYRKASESHFNDIKLPALFNYARALQKTEKLDNAKDEYLKIAYEYPDEFMWVGKSFMAAAEILVETNCAMEAEQLYRKVVAGNYPESLAADKKIKEFEKIK